MRLGGEADVSTVLRLGASSPPVGVVNVGTFTVSLLVPSRTVILESSTASPRPLNGTELTLVLRGAGVYVNAGENLGGQ